MRYPPRGYGPQKMYRISVEDVMKTTLYLWRCSGYMVLEYAMHFFIKSDVYNFGVLATFIMEKMRGSSKLR